MTKRKLGVVKKRPRSEPMFPMHFKVTAKQYRYLARMSLNRPMVSMFRERMFPVGWDTQELPRLEKIQRAARISDATFQHPKELKLSRKAA